MTPNSGGGSSIAPCRTPRLSDSAGELLRSRDVGGHPTRPAPAAARRRWRLVHGDPRSPNNALAKREWRANGRTTSGSRLPAAIIDACTAMASRFARKGAEVSMKTVWPSVHGGSPGSCPSTATGRPAKAVANMPILQPVGISAFRHRPPPPSILTKYLFQSRGPARSESTKPFAREQIFGVLPPAARSIVNASPHRAATVSTWRLRSLSLGWPYPWAGDALLAEDCDRWSSRRNPVQRRVS